MVLGSSLGLVAYYQIGWFTASLIGAAVSGITFAVCCFIWPDDFEFDTLADD
jgi:hypothetical protein